MKKQISAIILTASMLALTACETTTNYYGDKAAQPASSTASSDVEALRSYYAGLNTPMPSAGANAALDMNAPLTRIAFGSCVNENRAQDFWNVISATNPDLFLFIGDNVYGDTGATWAADMPTLSASYATLAGRSEFASFRANTPMLTTWDDHDYGANDAGGSFAFKERAEDLYEAFWNVSEEVKSRPGVYESRMVGPEGQRVQIILLDTRFFRSDLKRAPYGTERSGGGYYTPNTDPDATMLGDAQWRWLDAELSKPADLRLIVTSLQMITKAHGWEAWDTLPLERQKFYDLIQSRNAGNTVLLSGDRHSGALYKTNLPAFKNPLWEITSSSLNFSFGKGDNSEREPDSDRVGGFYSDENFGLVDIDWANKNVRLSLKHSDGREIIARDVKVLK